MARQKKQKTTKAESAALVKELGFRRIRIHKREFLVIGREEGPKGKLRLLEEKPFDAPFLRSGPALSLKTLGKQEELLIDFPFKILYPEKNVEFLELPSRKTPSPEKNKELIKKHCLYHSKSA